MVENSSPKVSFPRFNEQIYLSENRDAREAVESGAAENALSHYIQHGIDENRIPQIRREPAAIQGAVERSFVSESGYFLLLGWLADEGCEVTKCRLYGSDFNVEIPMDAVLRHARKDVESLVREGAYDYGYVTFGKTPSKSLLKQPLLVQAQSSTGSFQARTTPEVISDKRLLDVLLAFLASSQSHAGKEGALYSFLASSAGASTVDIFRTHVANSVASHHIRRFRPRKVSRSFVTVLFGSTEAMLLQPALFRQQKIDFGEWMYVCNSIEDANAVLRIGRLISDLYDVMITVIVVSDNIGFGAANNLAIGEAAGDSIYVINPDVYPLPGCTALLRDTLEQRDLGSKLWGGLLFYDDCNLMHSGMYMEQDSYFRCRSFNRRAGQSSALSFNLLRVEHFDKGVPFEEARWRRPKVVPAITGAVMAFQRSYFESLGGFSTRYIYGHYEDADLSLRWAQEHGPVVIDPNLRLVHMEGQGSRARGDEYRGAAIVNRYFFTLQHIKSVEQNGDLMNFSRELTLAGE